MQNNISNTSEMTEEVKRKKPNHDRTMHIVHNAIDHARDDFAEITASVNQRTNTVYDSLRTLERTIDGLLEDFSPKRKRMAPTPSPKCTSPTDI